MHTKHIRLLMKLMRSLNSLIMATLVGRQIHANFSHPMKVIKIVILMIVLLNLLLRHWLKSMMETLMTMGA